MLIANPNSSDATVAATYLLPSGQTLTKTYNVGANSRFNIWVDLEDAALANTAVSTTLVSNVPVIVERSMWWPNGGANWFEAHNSPGATVTGTKWALAEGEVGGAGSTETYVLIANTSATAGSALVTLLFEDGTTASHTFPLAASSRFNVDVRAEFPQAVGKRFGVVVESVGSVPAQIVVERAMYSNANGVTGPPAPTPSRHVCSEAGRSRLPSRAARDMDQSASACVPDRDAGRTCSASAFWAYSWFLTSSLSPVSSAPPPPSSVLTPRRRGRS